jgi:cytidylate kinase
MDGRDIGTVILPDADVKIFMTASAECRAQRRFEELKAKGIDAKYEDVLSEMNERDKNDSTREIAPAQAAEDAILYDNSGMTLEENVEGVIQIINQKVGK